MRVPVARVRGVLLVTVLGGAACEEVTPGQGDSSTGSGAEGTTFVPVTAGDDAPSDDEAGFDADSGEPPSSGGQCDYFVQDCRDGEKCSPWSELADLVPDEARCCPVQVPVVEAGDVCSLSGHLGSCIDNCTPGTICLDIDGDSEGVCQTLCGGTAEQPKCEPEQECFVYFGGVPLCFDTCDPLLQNCSNDKGCYPDAIAEGGTGFLCMPTIGDNQLGDYCWLLAGCNPGMVCATPPLLPDCYGNSESAGCCTSLCDITESPDPCKEVHPELECIAWYHQGAPPPSNSLANTGACALPTVGG